MSYWCNGFPDQSKTALQLAVSASDTPSAALWLSAYCQANLIQQSQQYAKHINLIAPAAFDMNIGDIARPDLIGRCWAKVSI